MVVMITGQHIVLNKGKVWGEMGDSEVKGANREQMELFLDSL